MIRIPIRNFELSGSFGIRIRNKIILETEIV